MKRQKQRSKKRTDRKKGYHIGDDPFWFSLSGDEPVLIHIHFCTIVVGVQDAVNLIGGCKCV